MWNGGSKLEEDDWDEGVLEVANTIKFLSGAKAHDRNEAEQR